MHPPVPGYGAPPPPPGPEKASGYGRAYGHQPQSYVVQPWAAPPVVQPQPWYNNLGGGSFFLLRLAIVAAVVVLVGVGSCVAAIAR